MTWDTSSRILRLSFQITDSDGPDRTLIATTFYKTHGTLIMTKRLKGKSYFHHLLYNLVIILL